MTCRVWLDEDLAYVPVAKAKRRKTVTAEDHPDEAEESLRGALGDDYVEHIDDDR